MTRGPETDREPRPLPEGDVAANRRLMDAIAEAFDASRQEPWPQVVSFLERLHPGSRVVDVAAGNGRHSLAAGRAGHVPVALDASRLLPRRFVARAHDEGLHVDAVEGDALRLPFGDGAFDAGLFIAGVHSIRGRDARLAALREFRRVLSSEAHGLVSVWARSQERFREHFERERDVHPQRVAAHRASGLEGPPPEFGDIDLPWGHDVPERVPRFFHLYTMPELIADLQASGFRIGPREEATLGRGPRPDNYFVEVMPHTDR